VVIRAIGILPLTFLAVTLTLAITGGVWLPKLDALLVALEAVK
jgi:hypothetical protein